MMVLTHMNFDRGMYDFLVHRQPLAHRVRREGGIVGDQRRGQRIATFAYAPDVAIGDAEMRRVVRPLQHCANFIDQP